jgi:hypothetical protein
MRQSTYINETAKHYGYPLRERSPRNVFASFVLDDERLACWGNQATVNLSHASAKPLWQHRGLFDAR